jgi:hypothetical protein
MFAEGEQMYTIEEAKRIADQYSIKNNTKYYIIHQPETTYELLYNTGYRIVLNPRGNCKVVYETNELRHTGS